MEREIIPALLLRGAAELCIIRNIMKCARYSAVRINLQVITHKLGNLFPQ
nr:MAG TPA: hypothetical protein [Caudoviricetes sp.]